MEPDQLGTVIASQAFLMVSPELPARAIAHAPHRIQPVVRRIVTLRVPATTRPIEPD